jgi:3-hydroxy-9,10-secoandrosta-1,3,5(10)-triene-9,17-dione monooxygenase
MSKPISPPEPDLTPVEVIRRAEAMRPMLRERQPLCEKLGRLPEETNEEFVRAGFYRILQPRLFGGYEFDLKTFARVMIEISRGCVESGWVLALTAGHPAAFIALFEERAQVEAYGPRGELRAPGVAAPGGTAIPVEGGYRIKGTWDYASGIDIATHFLGALLVVDPVTQVPQAYVYALLQRADWQVVDNWNVFGMQGTGSRRVVVEERFLPSHRMMELADATLATHHRQPGRALFKNPLYHGDNVPLLIFELVSVAVGAARGALDLYEEILRTRKYVIPPFTPRFEMPNMQQHFGDAQGLVDTAEAALMTLIDQYTEACRAAYVDGVATTREAARRLQRAQQQCVKMTWEAVELMFRTAGSASAARGSALGRYFRNMAVIQTHVTVQSDLTSANVARLRFGLPPQGAL